MEKLKINAYFPVIIAGLIICILAAGCLTNATPSKTPGTSVTGTTALAVDLSQPVFITTPVVFPPGSTQDSVFICNPEPRIPVPVDTSIPIRDPMPGVRYSLNRSESDRTIILGKGEIVEINLGFAPGLAMRWTVPVSGCGLELINDGTYYTDGDFWNSTGYYRARYRAVSPGTSVLNGKLVVGPDEPGDPRFNLTVVVT